VCFSFALAASEDEALLAQFAKYISKYNKQYNSRNEYWQRFYNYKASLATSVALSGEGGALFGETKFSDMTPEEFKSKVLMTQTKPSTNEEIAPYVFNSALAPTLDWRDKGAVTPVKDQGQCGSCWAFSATEAIESAWILKGHATSGSINLSPQQIVDCDHDGVAGCGGGFTESAYKYIASVGGQEGIANYPYKAKDGTCQFNASYVKAQISTFANTGGDENTLQSNLAQYGPLSICLDAAHWQNYQSGVMTARQCCPFVMCEMDHCVQLVGYNTTASPAYWIVRNSWNTDWGIAGYIYLEIGSNVCGITKDSTWPTSL